MSEQNGNLDSVSLGFFLRAMAIRRSEEATARHQQIVDAHRGSIEERIRDEQLLETIVKKRNLEMRDRAMEFLKSQGFEFDSVKASEVNGISTRGGGPLDKALQDSWDFIPKKMLSKIKDALSQKRSSWYQIVGSEGRGSNYSPNVGVLKISTIRGEEAVLSAMLHEQGHGLFEETMGAIGYLEHAFLERRVSSTSNGGKLGLIDANRGSNVNTNLTERRSLSGGEFSSPYTGRIYQTGSWTPDFAPREKFFEVFTTGLEDLFTEPGGYSTPGTAQISYAGPNGTELIVNPYRDPNTGRWYRDSTMNEPLLPAKIKKIRGRSSSSGIDTELKGFTLGVLMMMHDWRA
jgi:hypothetical protein